MELKLPGGRYRLSKLDKYTGEFKGIDSGYLMSKFKVGECVRVGSISSATYSQSSPIKEIQSVTTRKGDDGEDLYTIKFQTESGSIYELRQFD